MNKYILLSLLIATLLLCDRLNGQDVVISEYKNATNASSEWTEILNVLDNHDLRGFVLRDNFPNAGVANEWQGGVRFKNVDLWNNLRSGTIIVIKHRGSIATDNNKSDGYIEVAAEDSRYFEKVSYGDISEWSNKALSIDSEADILELIDDNDNHKHSLSHMSSPDIGDYFSLGSPKVNHQSGNIGNEYSVKVVPGDLLGDYGSGSGTNETNASGSPHVTKGLPNTSISSAAENQALWRQLRQPYWFGAEFTETTLRIQSVTLRWTKSEDPVQSDKTQGYVLLRIPTADLSSAGTPVDGNSYGPGDMLGSGRVVYSGTNITYVDNFEVPCGESYTYRAYAYRYDDDDLNQDTNPRNGRGRSYNEDSYAETTVVKDNPPVPVLTTISGKTEFCDDEIALLIVEAEGGPFTFTWTKSGVLVADDVDTLKIAQSGSYKVEITNEFGCSLISDSLDISFYDTPDGFIYADGVIVENDTSMTLCEGDDLTLTSSDALTIEWYSSNETGVISTEKEITVDEDGYYYYKAYNSDQCQIQSSVVNVLFIDVDFRVNKSNLVFNIAVGEDYDEKTITLTNNSKDTLYLYESSFNLPDEFSIVDPPAPPYVFRPEKWTNMTFRFDPDRPGDYEHDLEIKAPCDFSAWILLEGYEDLTNLMASETSIEFEDFLTCTTVPIDTSIFLINSDTKNIVVQQPDDISPFTISGQVFPITVPQNDSVEVTIEFSSVTDGIFDEELVFAYYPEGFPDALDTIITTLHAEAFTAAMGIDATNMDLAIPDCESYIDTTIKVYNTGTVDIDILEQPSNGAVKFRNLPLTIPVMDSAVLEVRFEPLSAADLGVDINVDVPAKPCDLEEVFVVHGSKNGWIFSFTNDGIVDFGTIVRCEDPIDASAAINLNKSGDSPTDAVISTIEISGNISGLITLDIIEGQILSDVNVINIDFPAAPDGIYSGEIKLTIDPCGIEKVIEIMAVRAQPEYELWSSEVDFGILNNPANETLDLTLTNTGTAGITISGIEGLAAPFSLSASNQAFPISLDTGMVVDIFFDYVQDVISNDIMVVDLIISDPCPDTLKVTLRGETKQIESGDAVAIIPNPPLIAPGDQFLIAVRLTAVDPLVLADADITRIEFEMGYNPNLMMPLEIFAGSAFTFNPGTYFEFDITSPGIVKIVIDNIESDKVVNGEFALLKSLALLGDKPFDDLVLRSAVIVAEMDITVETRNGRLVIDPGCARDNRLVRYDDLAYLMIPGPNPMSSDCELAFRNIDENILTLELFNTRGQLVETIARGYYKAGWHYARLNISGLADGMYMAVYRTGNTVIHRKIIVIK